MNNMRELVIHCTIYVPEDENGCVEIGDGIMVNPDATDIMDLVCNGFTHLEYQIYDSEVREI